jgi:hypothetical protein
MTNDGGSEADQCTNVAGESVADALTLIWQTFTSLCPATELQGSSGH